MFSTSGNQILDSTSAPVRLTGVTWNGFELADMIPDGLWTRNWREMLNHMRRLGFNTLRIPFASNTYFSSVTFHGSALNTSINNDLIGLTPIQILDKIVEYARRIGLLVILSHYRVEAGFGEDTSGLWYNSVRTESDWINLWKELAVRYAENPHVIGADLHNAPRGSWGERSPDWAATAELCANEIHAVNPNWLVFIQGCEHVLSSGDRYWAGSQFLGAKTRPLRINRMNKLVYAVREFSPSVNGDWSWFKTENGFPGSVKTRFEAVWGWIFEEKVAPVIAIEVGSRLDTATDNTWFNTAFSYFDGNMGPSGENVLGTNETGISFCWKSWGPTFSDTGGILNSDWINIGKNRVEAVTPRLFTKQVGVTDGTTDLSFSVPFTSEPNTKPVSRRGLLFEAAFEDLSEPLKVRYPISGTMIADGNGSQAGLLVDGRNAVRFTIDHASASASPWSVYIPGGIDDFTSEGRASAVGSAYWYGMRIRVPSEHYTLLDTEEDVLVEWKSTPDFGDIDRKPPLEFGIRKDNDGTNHFFLAYRADSNSVTTTEPVTTYVDLGTITPYLDKWIEVVWRIKWDYVAEAGRIHMWIDEKGAISLPSIAVGYNDSEGTVMRFGVKKSAWSTALGTGTTIRSVYYDDVRIGDDGGGYNAVAPTQSSNPPIPSNSTSNPITTAPIAISPYFYTQGNQIVDPSGKYVRFTGVSLGGPEYLDLVLSGLWSGWRWQDAFDLIKTLGFNCVRFPFCDDTILSTKTTYTTVNNAYNPDISGKTPYQVMKMMLDYCRNIGLFVILDHHRSKAAGIDEYGPNANGLWYADGAYTETQLINNWKFLATDLASNPFIVGADIHHEPAGATWGDGEPDWAAAAERIGNAIHSVNPKWLIFVQGVKVKGTITHVVPGQPYTPSSADVTWSGAQLTDAASRPIALATPNKLVYSPHDYGPGTSEQEWFSESALFPDNLPAYWDQRWGYLFYNKSSRARTAPVLLGSWGSKLDTARDIQWLGKLVPYINGDMNGDGSSILRVLEQGMSWTWDQFWPTGIGPGGLLADDWKSVRQDKMNVLRSSLYTGIITVPKV